MCIYISALIKIKYTLKYSMMMSSLSHSGTHYTIMQDSLDGRLFAIPQFDEGAAATQAEDELPHDVATSGSRDVATGGSHDPEHDSCVSSCEDRECAEHDSDDEEGHECAGGDSAPGEVEDDAEDSFKQEGENKNKKLGFGTNESKLIASY